MGLGTLGLGFLAAHPLGLIAGATAYVLGWVYLPDLPFFRGWVDQQRDHEEQEKGKAEVETFRRRRDILLETLSTDRRQRYALLAAVCRDIELAGAEDLLTTANPEGDPRLRKLDELMWTYLRLLSIEESLDRFLETEQRENVPAVIGEAEAEVAELNLEVKTVRERGDAVPESRQRLLESRRERLDVLRKRLQRIEQARENLALSVAEQERLDQQIKLIRADAVASRNAETLTARINATVEHLDQTNRWLSEMDEFKDLVGDMPATNLRVGFESSAERAGAVRESARPKLRQRP